MQTLVGNSPLDELEHTKTNESKLRMEGVSHDPINHGRKCQTERHLLGCVASVQR